MGELRQLISGRVLDRHMVRALSRLTDLLDTIMLLEAQIKRCKDFLPPSERAAFIRALQYIESDSGLPLDQKSIETALTALRALGERFEAER